MYGEHVGQIWLLRQVISQHHLMQLQGMSACLSVCHACYLAVAFFQQPACLPVCLSVCSVGLIVYLLMFTVAASNIYLYQDH